MIRVVLENLVKRYDGVAVVDGASMEVRPGELTFLLGPSGSGKTTMARLVAGLEKLDDGEIYFDGRLVQDQPPQARRVGLLFQDDALWPHLTVAENLAYPLKVKGVPRRDRKAKVAEALGAARLDTLGGKRAESLSGLQRQRVSLARVLVLEPDLLILTSDAREALALADHLAIMDLGRIVQSGPPAEVYNRPIDAFVARFLGPINLIQGQVESTDPRGDLVVRTPLGRLIGRAGVGPLPSGTPVTVALRPEALEIGPSAAIDANRFAATVERLVFLGETRQIHLRAANDWPVVALALQSQSQTLREGQGLTVHVRPEYVVVLASKFAQTTEPAATG